MSNAKLDYNIDNQPQAGIHLILDLYGVDANFLTNELDIVSVLTNAAENAGATILSSNFHNFGDNCGITGVLVLSESHISIHTWPEINYSSIDIYMCGSCDPIDTLKCLLAYFSPKYYESYYIKRGSKTIYNKFLFA